MLDTQPQERVLLTRQQYFILLLSELEMLQSVLGRTLPRCFLGSACTNAA